MKNKELDRFIEDVNWFWGRIKIKELEELKIGEKN